MISLDELNDELLKLDGILFGLVNRLEENPLDAKAWGEHKYYKDIHQELLTDIQEAGLREIE